MGFITREKQCFRKIFDICSLSKTNFMLSTDIMGRASPTPPPPPPSTSSPTRTGEICNCIDYNIIKTLRTNLTSIWTHVLYHCIIFINLVILNSRGGGGGGGGGCAATKAYLQRSETKHFNCEGGGRGGGGYFGGGGGDINSLVVVCLNSFLDSLQNKLRVEQ